MQRSSLCVYCNDAPVATALGYDYTCADCTYVCFECDQTTPYESGSTCCELCDNCHYKLNIEHNLFPEPQLTTKEN